MGGHERHNRRWIQEHGAGMRQRDPRFVADRIAEWRSDGTLAASAWSGFLHLPQRGLCDILEILTQARRAPGIPQQA